MGRARSRTSGVRARQLLSWHTTVVLIGAAGLTAPATSSAAQDADDVCAQLEPVEVGGTVEAPQLLELSGLAGSPHHSDVLWAHNDSGGVAELYAFAEDGTSLGTYAVEGANITDWEDMAAGPAPNGSGPVLYIGDIGDNGAERRSVTVYRVSEPGQVPTAPGVPLTEVEAIELRYPGGPSDAEALLIDPRTGDLVIVTKSLLGASRVLTAEAASLAPGAPVDLIDAGALVVPRPPDPGLGLPGTAVTGGDVSPDGSIVLLRTYRSVLAFARADGQSLADALMGDPCFAPQEEELQGEAIAFTGDGTAYVTASEGPNVPIHRVGVTAPGSATTTTAAAVPTTSAAASESDSVDDDSSTATLLVAFAIALLVIGVGAWAWSRRGRGSVAG